MKVPFVDLHAQYLTIKNEVDHAIQSVINETAFIRGKFVDQFENDYAKLYGVNHCIGVANGTDAIYIALKMLGVGKGDEVITVANSWISTSETISQAGATPVFIDIEPDHYTIDVDRIEKKITEKTKAIIPVHLYGHPADLDPIVALCKKYDLRLIEDCAQAHFAEYKGRRVGLFGDVATFSFYPGKNLGAYGDAGAIVTNDDELAERCRMFANHGALTKHGHKIEGINSRLDGLQAAILSAKLPYILDWTKKRKELAITYNELLKDLPEIAVPKVAEFADHVYHLYVIRTERRDKLRNELASHGIGTGVHYPTPLPLLPAYRHLNYVSIDIPIASKYSEQIISIPMYPELSFENQQYIQETITRVL